MTGFVALPKEDLVSSYKSILTVVTIATDESFKDVSDFVINLDKVEPTVPIVIYDLGISQNNLQLVFRFHIFTIITTDCRAVETAAG